MALTAFRYCRVAGEAPYGACRILGKTSLCCEGLLSEKRLVVVPLVGAVLGCETLAPFPACLGGCGHLEAV